MGRTQERRRMDLVPSARFAFFLSASTGKSSHGELTCAKPCALPAAMRCVGRGGTI